MDLRPYKPTQDQIDIIKQSGYQPWILSDECQTGEGYIWCKGGTSIDMMEKSKVSRREWEAFVDANQRMRRMYDSWIDSLAQLAGITPQTTVCDTAMNTGYFLYSLMKKGAGRAWGYELNDYSRLIEILNKLMGVNVEVIRRPYDMWLHKIPDAEPADIVISAAIMCHVSDPLYYMSFLGSITKKALFLFSSIDNESKFRITWDGAKTTHSRNNPFPICFDGMARVSRGLVDFGLKEMGFTKIVELPYQRDWLPYSWYKYFQAIVAIR